MKEIALKGREIGEGRERVVSKKINNDGFD
jgi:hypothetical protein